MDMYLHVRVLFTIILGLGVSRLLSGVAKLVQHPKSTRSTVCISCGRCFFFSICSFLVLGISHTGGSTVDISTLLPSFSMYAVMQYLVCVLLFPEEMADGDSFKE
jgi:hypothetical protein